MGSDRVVDGAVGVDLDGLDTVLVVDDSRLARDELTAAVIRSKLREAGVKLITLSGETDLNDPTGRFTSGVLALTAQLEQDIRREKMMAGLQAAARRGYWTGGPAPYGYKCVPTPDGHTTLEVDKPKPNSSTPPPRSSLTKDSPPMRRASVSRRSAI